MNKIAKSVMIALVCMLLLSSTAAAAKPNASFTYTQTSFVAPLTVQFTDRSSNTSASWSWDFGDGTDKSIIQNPEHTYTASGT